MADKGLSFYQNLNRSDADNAAEIKRIYQEWADRYDADNDGALGTVSQPTMVHLFANHADDKAVKILDVGCGTGLVGHHLTQAGYLNFDGTDLSPEMIAHATARGYQNLFTSNLATGLPLEDDTYYACLCVGVFTHGHVGPQGLDELTRITKQGGLIGFTVNEDVYASYGFDEAIDILCKTGKWQLIIQQTSDYMTKKDVKGIYVLARVIVAGK